MVIYEIKNTKRDETTPATFAQILSNFAGGHRPSLLQKLLQGKKDHPLILEIAVFRQSIHFFMIVEKHLSSYFTSQLGANYPTARITPVTDYLSSFKKAPAISIGQLKLREEYYYPLNTYKTFKDHDAMSSFLGILSRFSEHEAAVMQVILLPGGSHWHKHAESVVEAGNTDSEGKRKPIPHESAVREKAVAAGLLTGIRIVVVAPTKTRADSLLSDLSGSLGVLSRGDGNSLGLKKPGLLSRQDWANAIFNRTHRFIPKFQYLTADEVATIFHPPGKILSGIKNIAWGGQMRSEPPENLPVKSVAAASDAAEKNARTSRPTTNEINFFARTEFKNTQKTFGIRREDRRKHLYTIGKTGTGKTTLIANMAINDIRNGEGLAIIDPHGDLCNIILDYIPKKRINDVAYLDPSDTNFPFHLNPLELPKGSTRAEAELVASGIVSIFYKLYQYSWGPRMEYILRNALLTLTYLPDATLVDIPKILAQKEFRDKVVQRLDDHVLKGFWEHEYDQMSDKFRTEAIAPILNKIGQFVTSPMIRNIIGNPHSTVDLAKMMDEGKIVIVNLSQGKLGEDNAALLGAMFITKMQLAAMARVYKEEHERRDFYLYVDEFQNFATKSFLKILSEARKYRLNLILANQYAGQIEEDVKKAIFGNIGSLVAFLVGAEDARALSSEFGSEYLPEDFVALGNFQILLKMAIDGKTSTPFYATTLPLPKVMSKNKEKIIKVSRERYAKKIG